MHVNLGGNGIDENLNSSVSDWLYAKVREKAKNPSLFLSAMSKLSGGMGALALVKQLVKRKEKF